MRRCAEPCRTFSLNTHMYARARALTHAGFAPLETGSAGSAGRQPAKGAEDNPRLSPIRRPRLRTSRSVAAVRQLTPNVRRPASAPLHATVGLLVLDGNRAIGLDQRGRRSWLPEFRRYPDVR